MTRFVPVVVDSKTFIKKLEKRGVKFRIETLLDLAKAGIISGRETSSSDPQERGRPRSKNKGQGKRSGRFNYEWDDTAVADATAVWAVQHSPTKTNLSWKRLEELKKAADRVYRYPAAFYDLPPGVRITGPEPTSQWSWRALKMYVDADPVLDAQVKTWIAGKEKAKAKQLTEVSEPKRVVFHWTSHPRTPNVRRIEELPGWEDIRKNELPSAVFIDEEKLPGHLQEYVHMIGKDAIPPDDKADTKKPRDWKLIPTRWTFTLETELEDALRDELVFILDGVDSREKAMYAPFDEYKPGVHYDPEIRRKVRIVNEVLLTIEEWRSSLSWWWDRSTRL
jgi:hypothetical protein